jgi:hypothetical protein
MSETAPPTNISQRADEMERQMSQELDRLTVKSVLYTSGERDPTQPVPLPKQVDEQGRMHYFQMGHDARLPKMPDRPTLLDFFKYRFGPSTHLLQSARLARKAGHPEKIVLACLLHDIGVAGFIRSDHGYWAAQLLEPYVEEEVSWAIRAHQVLRFYPDEDAGYSYPEMYIRLFGPDFKPEPYVEAAYQRIRKHKWYMTARLITINDTYAFDPSVKVSMDDFVDIIGRNFRQPEEGLGFDDSPSAHMWRTINWPTRYL